MRKNKTVSLFPHASRITYHRSRSACGGRIEICSSRYERLLSTQHLYLFFGNLLTSCLKEGKLIINVAKGWQALLLLVDTSHKPWLCVATCLA